METPIVYLIVLYVIQIQALVINPYENTLLKREPSSMSRSLKDSDVSFDVSEEVDGYPGDKIVAVLNNGSDVFKSYFGSIYKPFEKKSDKGVSLTSRIGEDGETFCKSLKTTKYPQLLKDVNDQNRTVINVKPPFIQSITFELCDHRRENSFFENIGFTPLDYDFFCQQKFTIIKLLYYDKITNEVAYGSFPVPSSCVCVYRNRALDYRP